MAEIKEQTVRVENPGTIVTSAPSRDNVVEMEPGSGMKLFRSFLKSTIHFDASDLIIKAGYAPKVRLRGTLKPLKVDSVSRDEMFQNAREVLDEEQYDSFRHRGSADFAYAYDDDSRFRVNMFMARGNPAIAARLITSNIIGFEQLRLQNPEVMADVAMSAQGLVLLSGVTGSGKSTTIAAMLQYINERKAVHIVTIEDPIEYIFKDAKAFINQREVGIDCVDFNDALRALVRENPDVVLIGEMRDKETFEAAIRAAETGHLVFGTIHASSAWQSFGRIYDLFTPGEREQIRKLLAYNLQAIIYQKLLPTLHKDIGRIPAIEILLNTTVVRKFILEGREGELLDVIRNNREAGMIDFTSSLVQLVEDEYIHYKIAMAATPNPEELSMRLKGIS